MNGTESRTVVSELTEEQLFNTLLSLVQNKTLNRTDTKKQYRTHLEKQYTLANKSLKYHSAFISAMERFVEHQKEENAKQNSENTKKESTQKTDNKNKKTKPNKSKKSKGKKRKKSKKNRKRKRSNHKSEQQIKKRKTNRKSSKKKKKIPQKTTVNTLEKLRKLLRATNLYSPKIYSEMKNTSETEQIQYLTNIFTENDIDSTALSDTKIEKIKQNFALRKEVQDLGITNENNSVAQGRVKRNKKKVSYAEDMSSESGTDDQSFDPDYGSEDSDISSDDMNLYQLREHHKRNESVADSDSDSESNE